MYERLPDTEKSLAMEKQILQAIELTTKAFREKTDLTVFLPEGIILFLFLSLTGRHPDQYYQILWNLGNHHCCLSSV